MKKIILILLIACIIAPANLFCGIYGSLKGRVVDAAGEPQYGATVQIEGTSLGAMTDEKGGYTILGIKPGVYNVIVKMIGFKAFKQSVEILADRVGALNAALVVEAGVLDEVVILGERPYESYKIGTSAVLTTTSFSRLDHDDISGTVGTSAGVTSSGSGYVVRGTRDSETSIRVDGIGVGSSYTGGYSAEYGGAAPVTPAGDIAYKISDSKADAPDAYVAKSGILTSGEVNDFRKWDLWKDISENDLKSNKSAWGIQPDSRYTLQLVAKNGAAIIDAEVTLENEEGDKLWEAKTDNTGKAELWLNIFNSVQGEGDNIILVKYNGKTFSLNNLTEFHNGVNILTIDETVVNPNKVDILFAIDATGSMGDEIQYLKDELNDIIGKIKEKHPKLEFNLGSLFYRDVYDDYLVRKFDFTTDIKAASDFIKLQYAMGGGDFEEAVEIALDSAVNGFSWSDKAVSRMMFLILDAPPHNNPEVVKKLKELSAKAAAKGIRIIPVTCSGIDKSTEYLMRALALATNGTYAFLTNHSGIGSGHIEPTTDKYNVELLNDLFIRLIAQFTAVQEFNDAMNLKEIKVVEKILNHDEAEIEYKENEPEINIARFYPNPTKGELTAELGEGIEEMYLVDIAGKILMKMTNLSEGKQELDLGRFPSGVYFFKFLKEERWGTAKLLLHR